MICVLTIFKPQLPGSSRSIHSCVATLQATLRPVLKLFEIFRNKADPSLYKYNKQQRQEENQRINLTAEASFPCTQREGEKRAMPCQCDESNRSLPVKPPFAVVGGGFYTHAPCNVITC